MDTLYIILAIFWFPNSWIQVVVISLFYSLIYSIFKHYCLPYRVLRRTGIPFDRPTYLVGNNFDFDPLTLHKRQLEQQKKYGLIYGDFFFTIPTIFIADPEMIKSIMVTHFSNFCNRFQAINMPILFEKSILRIADEPWKRIRTVMIGSFSAAKLKPIGNLVSDSCRILMISFDEGFHKNKKVSLTKPCEHLSMHVLLAAAFGIEFETLKDESKITEAVNVLFANMPVGLRMVMMLSIRLWEFLEPLMDGKVLSSMDYLMQIVLNVINDRRNNIKLNKSCRQDILQMLIEAGDKGKLTDEEIVAQVFFLMVGGYQTTANTLMFALHSIATNSNVQEKSYNEIQAKYDNNNCHIDYDFVLELPYLKMVLEETTRMYPPVIFPDRGVKEDITINGLLIPKKVMIGFPTYAIHHNPDYWPNPEEFRPERFTVEEKAKQIPFSYITFGGGQRHCLGMRLAKLEVKMAIVNILLKYELFPVEETKVPLEIKSEATLMPAEEIILGLKKR
ncbi:Cytochrome P450 3A5 [Trichoplax sp. H2]|nr:Cytochrome P450 3A5 [Trichoplax sp. H2]|eukprot:RDD39448.1 Cytochrome P450 3A5 [Trichoplax sp. H2]